MTSTMRLTFVAVLLLGAAAIGLIMYPSKPVPTQVVQTPPPLLMNYFVAARRLPAGTLVREEDFSTRSITSGDLPSGAIIVTPEARANLRGSLVRSFLDADHPVTAADLLRPRDSGFLAAVLAPGSRATSISVDAESGVSGLVWPGDRVDVLLTHDIDKTSPDHRSVSEVVIRDVRIIGIDQDIVQGAPANSSTVGKVARTVTLQLAPEQVVQVTEAQHLGKLSLAVRAAGEQQASNDRGIAFSGDVSTAIAEQAKTRTVVVYDGGKEPKTTEFTFKAGR